MNILSAFKKELKTLRNFSHRSEKRLFEWGAGNSTHYWASRVKEVVCVEDNKEWYENIRKDAANNVSLILHKDKNSYVNEIEKYPPFDIIVIDANHRSECADLVKSSLSKGGIVIFDNADRYPKSCQKIRNDADLIQVDFHGFSPINFYSHTTSIFLSRDVDLKSKTAQPRFSYASLKELKE